MSISGFNDGEHIFGENIDYTGSIKVAINSITDVEWNGLDVAEVKVVFEVDNNTQLTYLGTGSMPILRCLQPKYQADTTWNFISKKTYLQNHFVSDHKLDSGYFNADFSMSVAEMKEMREFYRQVRGAAFQLNSSNIKGITRLFGTRNIALPVNVRIKSLKEKFNGVNSYIVSIEFVQESALEA